jgi:uncharacterized OB-fold protein
MGTIYAVTTLHGGVGDFAGYTYNLAYVDVDDGPRMLTNIVDSRPTDVRIGSRVEVLFEVTPGGAWLPRFRVAL